MTVTAFIDALMPNLPVLIVLAACTFILCLNFGIIANEMKTTLSHLQDNDDNTIEPFESSQAGLFDGYSRLDERVKEFNVGRMINGGIPGGYASTTDVSKDNSVTFDPYIPDRSAYHLYSSGTFMLNDANVIST